MGLGCLSQHSPSSQGWFELLEMVNWIVIQVCQNLCVVENPVGKPTHTWGKLLSYWINWIPIASLCHINLGLGNAFVNTSTVCSGSRQFCISSILSVTRSWTQWWCKEICFDCWWNWGLWVNTMEPSLLPLIIVGGNPSSPYKFLSHVASCPASERATFCFHWGKRDHGLFLWFPHDHSPWS